MEIIRPIRNSYGQGVKSPNTWLQKTAMLCDNIRFYKILKFSTIRTWRRSKSSISPFTIVRVYGGPYRLLSANCRDTVMVLSGIYDILTEDKGGTFLQLTWHVLTGKLQHLVTIKKGRKKKKKTKFYQRYVYIQKLQNPTVNCFGEWFIHTR